VLEAEDGEKATEIINEGENRLMLDVIICDIHMPKVSGVEVIAYFRKEYPRVQLIVLTGVADVEMAASFMRQGVVDYLVKPVDAERLKAAVARAIDQREIHPLWKILHPSSPLLLLEEGSLAPPLREAGQHLQ